MASRVGKVISEPGADDRVDRAGEETRSDEESASRNDMDEWTAGKSRMPRRRQGAERPVDYEPSCSRTGNSEAAVADKAPIDRAFELFVYAPIGAAMYVRDMMPSMLGIFVARGKREVQSHRTPGPRTAHAVTHRRAPEGRRRHRRRGRRRGSARRPAASGWQGRRRERRRPRA